MRWTRRCTTAQKGTAQDTNGKFVMVMVIAHAEVLKINMLEGAKIAEGVTPVVVICSIGMLSGLRTNSG